MRRLLCMALLAALALGLKTSVQSAQEDTTESEAPDKPKALVPPPAWKSVEIANFYLKRKKYNAALSRFQEALKTDPYYPPAYLGLGRVYERIGLKQKALEAYRNYLDILPSAKDAQEAKEVHEAITRIERGLKTRRSSRAKAAPPLR